MASTKTILDAAAIRRAVIELLPLIESRATEIESAGRLAADLVVQLKQAGPFPIL